MGFERWRTTSYGIREIEDRSLWTSRDGEQQVEDSSQWASKDRGHIPMASRGGHLNMSFKRWRTAPMGFERWSSPHIEFREIEDNRWMSAPYGPREMVGNSLWPSRDRGQLHMGFEKWRTSGGDQLPRWVSKDGEQLPMGIERWRRAPF